MQRMLLILIVVVGSFLRLYHIPQTLLFLGDQGRDAILAKQILRDGDIALIGPVTSVGNMYLGPFYYYFMVPFLALTFPDPVGPAIGVAVLNSLSIFALFWVSRRLFSSTVALLASSIYALMPLAIQFSRFSWNPNLGAPVAIIVYWFLVRWIQTKEWKFVIGLGLSLGIIIQLHYVTLITCGLVGLNWLFAMIKEPVSRKKVLFQGITIVVLAVSLLTPLVVFDFRHNHMISEKFGEFFTSKNVRTQTKTPFSLIVRETEGRMYQLLSQMVSGQKNPPVDLLVGYGSIALFIWIKMGKKDPGSVAEYVVIEWLVLTVIGISFYSSSIFYHYLTFCIPIVALYWALLVYKLWRRHLIGKCMGASIGVSIGIICIIGIKAIPYNGIGTVRIQQTVKEVLPKIKQPYNLALIAENGDFQGLNYRYFFSVSDKPPQAIDDYRNLSQLIVIDEIKNGNPLSVPAFEIQAPHLTQLETSFAIDDGPHIYIYQ